MSQVSLWTLVLWQVSGWQPAVDLFQQVSSVPVVTKSYSTIEVGSDVAERVAVLSLLVL